VQRAIYDARRDLRIPAHGIRLVVVTPADLAADSRGRLRRDEARDLPAIRRLLSPPAWGEPETRESRTALNALGMSTWRPTSWTSRTSAVLG